MQIKMCERCQRNAPQLKTVAMQLHPVKVIPQVWYLVGRDLIGPFQSTADGNNKVLTILTTSASMSRLCQSPIILLFQWLEGFTKSIVDMEPQRASSVIKERSSLMPI